MKRSEFWRILLSAGSVGLAGLQFWAGVHLSGYFRIFPDPNVPPIVDSAFIFIFFLIVSQVIADHLREDERLSTIKGLLPPGPKVICAGLTDNAYKKVVARFGVAEHVWNTFVIQGDFPHAPKANTEIINAQVAFLNRANTRWEDIVSAHPGYQERAERVLNRTNVTDRSHYSVYKLDQDIPILNFIILQFPAREGQGAPKEVWFGWGFHKTATVDSVFISSDTEVVGMFERYFTSLKLKCMADEKATIAPPGSAETP